MAGTLFYLMQKPGCQKKLREELENAFNDIDEIRIGETLTGCVYLRACVEEALRMASSAPGISERTVLQVRKCPLTNRTGAYKMNRVVQL